MRIVRCLLTMLGCAGAASAALAADTGGLSTYVAVDMVGGFKADEDSTADDRLIVRGIEAAFFAPIDHVFDGHLSLAAHPEAGETVVELHEATIASAKLMPRTRIKAGQFFLGVGRLNRSHQHDWPFITAPNVHATFFGTEGALDSGVEFAVLAPTETFLELTAGVTNGWTYGHSHVEGEKPRKPTHYGRLATFGTLGDADMQWGFNYLGRRSNDGEETRLAGIDGVVKRRDGRVLRLLLQTEVWHRRVQPLVGDEEASAGTYVYGQYGFDAAWSLGLRADWFSVLTLEDASGDGVDNDVVALVPTLTYRASEFSTLRLAYTESRTHQDGVPDSDDRIVEVQATFVMGAHPAHDF